jgi:enoyl-CoA hydratase/carnithine racemase
MAYEFLTVERRGSVAVVTLNRPEKLNALNKGLQDDSVAVCGELEADDAVRAVVFTGAGRGFCAGADLTGGRPPSADDGPPPQLDRLEEYGWVGRQAVAIYEMTKPTIAAVNGVAAGAGMSFALACDMRVGSAAARFKTVFLERSLSPDSGMSFFLPRIVGYSRAVDLILSSRDVGADEAYRIGLLDRLVDADRLVEESVAVGDQMAVWPPMAVRSAKRVIQRNLQHDLRTALREEYNGLNYARKAPNDVRESRLSFVEKRKPNFTGT